MIELTKETYDAEVKESAIPVVVDFWGPQCGPCLALMPDVEALSKEYEGKVKFCKVNSAENRRLCISLRVMGLPTFLFVKDGEVANRITGDEITIDDIREHTAKLVS